MFEMGGEQTTGDVMKGITGRGAFGYNVVKQLQHLSRCAAK